MTTSISTLVTSRRTLLAGATGSVLAGLPASAEATRPRFRVAVATNEPWGTYHALPVLDDVLARGGSLTQIVPDRSALSASDPMPAVSLAQARPADFDLLVVNGATQWPATVVQALAGVPVVASSLAYLNPVLGGHAHIVTPRLVGATASSNAERTSFAAHLGIRAQRIRVVGTPALDERPQWAPEPRTVLVLTSVTHPSATGGAAPGAQLLLDSAHALKDAGYHILVGIHPREDRSLWANFDIAPEGSLAASTRAEVALGIPGSVFPKIAAVGVPLVATLDPALTVPQYLIDITTPAWTVADVLRAVDAATPLSQQALREVVGPMGHAGRTLAQYWFAASRARR